MTPPAAPTRRRRRPRLAPLVLAAFGLAGLVAAPFAASPARAADDAKKPAEAKKDKSAAAAPAEDPEVKMGRETHEEMLRAGLKLVKDPKLVERVERIGKKVAEVSNATPLPARYGSSKHTPYEYRFFVVDDPDVNAFCLPGGYIYVNRGLLNYVQSDDELAGVLGHEVIHAAHHHVAKLQREQSKLNTQMAIGLLAAIVARVPTNETMNLLTTFQLLAVQKVNGYGQTAEQDADHAGIILAHKAGYNPVGMLTFMERLARDQRLRPDVELGVFRTHPPEPERAKAMTEQITAMGLPINRRDVTNALRVQVRSITGTQEAGPAAKPGAEPTPVPGLSEVVLDGEVLYRTADAGRAKKIAESLDTALDGDVQMFEVARRGTRLLIRDREILAVEPEDVALAQAPVRAGVGSAAMAAGAPSSAEAVAEQAYKALRTALFRQFIRNPRP